ncbi:MAG: nickel/cobalt transporter, partial [Vibrio sp.]
MNKFNQASIASQNPQHVKSKMQPKTWIVFILTLGILALISYQAWLAWPSLMLKTIQWQREINDGLSQLLHQAKANQTNAAWSLLGLSTLYGFLHALGPGHGKIIVTTYLATHPTKVKTSLWITVISALLQAVVACVLVTSLLWLFQASMKQVNQESLNFIKASYGIMMLLGVVILAKSIQSIYRQLKPSQPQVQFQTIKPLTHTANRLIQGQGAFHQHNYQDGDTCGCGHKHIASQDELNQAQSWTEYLAIITSIGIRPCTGAIMVLLFANLLDIYWLGVVSSFAMAIGTALSTSSIALMTVSGRKLVRRYLNVGNTSHLLPSLIKAVAGLV